MLIGPAKNPSSTVKVDLQEKEEKTWPYFREQFNYKYKKGNNFVLQCKLSLQLCKLSAVKNSTSSQCKHLEVSEKKIWSLVRNYAHFSWTVVQEMLMFLY
ncbi:hypothetical protein ATANTOWER_017431 [Ataeniobius toweri]|uniref:Uncharacterized protein n=1 Tax=Ataeniobius toweri TaxID=208326 RepID=A0ABU7BZ65_9TELE|nr:hypothetical protein [Ataeniobius toweri]